MCWFWRVTKSRSALDQALKLAFGKAVKLGSLAKQKQMEQRETERSGAWAAPAIIVNCSNQTTKKYQCEWEEVVKLIAP